LYVNLGPNKLCHNFILSLSLSEASAELAIEAASDIAFMKEENS
jgi:hypothetical protein